MSSPDPSVVVIIVNYNSSDLLGRCLDCLDKQTLAPKEIIVVDNGSTDSLEFLESRANVRIMMLQENLGYGGAINRAVETIEDDDLFCCLNPDAFPRPEWLASLVRMANANPQFGSFASLTLRADDDGVIDGAGDLLHMSGIPWRRYHGKRLAETTIETGPIFSACGGAAMYRTGPFKEVGGFDESLFMYVEDVDLGFRLQLAGYPCLFVPDAIAEHIGSAITGERSDFSTYHGHRNLVFSYFKNMPFTLLLITLPLHIIANLWTVLVLTLRGSALVILRSKWDALVRIPSAIAARKPSNQKVSNIYIWHQLQKLASR